MLPTLQQGDLLFLDKTPFNDLQVGDLVIFSQQRGDQSINQNVIHRIINTKNNEYITRGDNNTHQDQPALTKEVYLGQVRKIERQGKIQPVLNGFWGWLYASFLYCKVSSWRLFKQMVFPLYDRLRRWHHHARWWQPTLFKLTLQTPDGELVKILHHGRHVARGHSDLGEFVCKKPYDWVIASEKRDDQAQKPGLEASQTHLSNNAVLSINQGLDSDKQHLQSTKMIGGPRTRTDQLSNGDKITYLRDPDVITKKSGSDDEVMIFQPDSGKVRELNVTGYFIWQQCTQPITQAMLSQVIIDEFDDVQAECVAADLDEYLNNMIDEGFIGVVSSYDTHAI